MKSELLTQIQQSGYIHRPLQINTKDSFETSNEQVEILKQKQLFPINSEEEVTKNVSWQHRHQGASELLVSGEIQLSSPTRLPQWPPDAPEDGDYSNFGQVSVYREVQLEDWQDYNQVSFEIYPNCPGAVNPHIIVGLKNDGVIKVPDIYDREGYHVANLENNSWNSCSLEITDLPRDAISELSFTYLMNGRDRGTGLEQSYLIRKITLEKTASSNVSKGWMPKSESIIYSHTGYQKNLVKTALMQTKNVPVTNFELVSAKDQEVVFIGKIQEKTTSIGSFLILDFSQFATDGEYYLRVGKVKTETFTIGNVSQVWQDSIWKSLNFIFCERCGCPVPDKHGSCHGDILATHNGESLVFNGGWHDAGDVSQQMIQTAEVTQSLFEMAAVVEHLDQQLYLRLMEEAEWGFDFILKTRFGDGYRATSVGITIWSDGLIGNMDDMIARVHNNAYENYLCSGIEAKIALLLPNENRLKSQAIAVAVADYRFAEEEFATVGFVHEPVFWEHTYSTSKSLFLATMSWSSSLLFKLTGEEYYAEKARNYMDEMLECQENKGLQLHNGELLKGFFYRDEGHQVVQHFNHQAREHLYSDALVTLAKTQSEHPDYQKWQQSIREYGDYLIYLMDFTAPYPMIASGVYLKDEALELESFHKQHLLVGDEAQEDYLKQLEQGEEVGVNLYVKRFPVWFSFRGNNAILLSMGKVAATLGAYLSDEDLLTIAENQLQWVVGKNPFNQSLMYGEGYRYAQQYSVLTGEMVGEMPVGVQTFGNEDAPYWPQLNNATYKEVWVGTAGKWLAILAEFYELEKGRTTK
ncbi:glycoside hydrolase family 9 protein [Carnobacterium gallinarum]|uniref:glycoside hydrolase family 9 protein n=1 Tax=Carnobacterium gallinarum TaxID=2749 RepID=UPI00055071BC|nr:glycoside hydrolase family 9 protein [Carnobacterium gallinarum]